MISFELLLMECAATLLQLVRDAAAGVYSSSLSESDLIKHLDGVRKQLQCSGSAEIGPEARAIAVCYVTAQVVAFLALNRPITAQTARSKWQQRVILLETAVASSLASVGSCVSEEDADFELKATDRRHFCYMYQRLLQRLWEIAQTPTQAVAVLTKLCVLLACCWLSYDRIGTLEKVQELLTVCSDFCLKHRETKHLAKWPLFLRGMVVMVEKKEDARALTCFQRAAGVCGDDESDGVLFYWYAVALLRNGKTGDAVAALDKCIRANYEPVACLSLQALTELQDEDFHAASEQLQRALEIDASQSRSLFNYALLMGRMENFEGQQQLLAFVLGSEDDNKVPDRKRKQPGGNADFSSAAEESARLFDKASLEPLFPSQRTSVNLPTVHLHLAGAAMENGSWLKSKKHFETFLSLEDLRISSAVAAETARDYVYVLLQCKLPSLALIKCEQFLLTFGENSIMKEESVTVSLLLLHLYKADALLCLERVDECYEYLKQTALPKVQDAMRQLNRPSDTLSIDVISEEIVSCHTQLLNNLAIATACRNNVDAAISILREGLQQYPDCLAIKFNLVLLLWRKRDESAACSIWFKARGWDLQANGNELESNGMAGDANRLAFTAAASATSSRNPSFSEHVQDNLNGEAGVSAQQLVYLDALILNYWRKSRNIKLADTSLQYIEYIESLGTTDSARHD
ncbi:hypothetical protein PRIC1_013887 [Phytophthora ramorum]